VVDRRSVPLARLVGDLFGGALGDEVAAFGEDVGDDVDEAFHVGHVEADGGFLDEVEVAFGVIEAVQASLKTDLDRGAS